MKKLTSSTCPVKHFSKGGMERAEDTEPAVSISHIPFKGRGEGWFRIQTTPMKISVL